MGTKNIEECWSRLEDVLADGDAVDAFMNWMLSESTVHPLKFHYSVIAFKDMVLNKNCAASELAVQIFDEYLSLSRGLCEFIDPSLRDEVGRRLRSPVDVSLFDKCLPSVQDYLRKQHESFLRSEEFINLVNSFPRNGCHSTRPSTSQAPDPVTASENQFASKHRHRKAVESKLTPQALLKSQHDRETLLGQSSVERMFSKTPAFKYPYVCNATTSKNDSTVSSNLSNETTSSSHRNFVKGHPRMTRQHDPVPLLPRASQTVAVQKHDTPEERRVFAESLMTKLNLLSEKLNRTERMNERIKEVDKRDKYSARDAVMLAGKSEVYSLADEDDDLDSYVKRRMARDDSFKPSPTQQSPSTFKNKRRSPKSCSPDPSIGRHEALRDPMSWSYSMASGKDFVTKPKKYGNYDDEDTSGIGSMTTTTQLSTSSFPIKAKHRAWAFQKAKELSSAKTESTAVQIPIKLCYKEANGVPYVAHVAKPKVTFRDFRKCLSIPSKTKKRFYFKTKSEDNTAPYELLLVDDDAVVLPVFEGCITAECRCVSDSD